jgi:hypothetical protein
MSRFSMVFHSHATRRKMPSAQAPDAAKARRLGRKAASEALLRRLASLARDRG